MILKQGNQDSLFTEEQSQGIIQESRGIEANITVPQSAGVAGVGGAVSSLTLPPTDLDAPIELQSEPLPEALPMGQFDDPFDKESAAAVKDFEETSAITYMDSVTAAVKSWDFMGMYDQYKLDEQVLDAEANLRGFDPEFDFKEALDTVTFPLAKEEVEWLHGKDIQSGGAFDLYIKDIERKRRLAKEASLAPVTTTVLGFADPTYIALGGVVAKTAQVARAGRYGTTLMVGASELAMVEAQTYHRPVSNFERVLGTVLPSALTVSLYRAPKTVQNLDGTRTLGETDNISKAKLSTPEYDPDVGKPIVGKATEEVVDHLDNIDTINVTRNTPLTKEKPEIIKPKDVVEAESTGGTIRDYKKNEYGLPHRSELDWDAPNAKGVPLKNTAYKWVYDVIEDVKIPKSVRDSTARLLMQAGRELAEFQVKFVPKLKGQGRFYIKDNVIEIRGSEKNLPKTFGQTLNHEIVHGLTSLRLAFGKLNPESGHGQVVKEIEELRKHVTDNYNKHKDDFKPREQKEIEYALQDNDEFLAGLFEGDTTFKKMMQETPADAFQYGSEKNLLQSLYTGFRRLLGLTPKEATALNKALKLTDDLLDEPRVKYTDIHGNMKEFKASEVTPELIVKVATEEADEVYKQAAQSRGSKVDLGLNLFKGLFKVAPEFARKVLSSPYAGEMTDNAVSSKRSYSARLSMPRIDAEQAFNKELAKRGVTGLDRFFSTKKYHETVRQLESEIAYYVEVRSQAEDFGRELPARDGSAVEAIADNYQRMTKEAQGIGVRAGLFDEGLDKDWYLPRKIDPEEYAGVMERVKAIYGEDKAESVIVDLIASKLKLEGGDAEYTRHIAYVYYQRIYDRYHSVGDNFRSHSGDDTVKEVNKYLGDLDQYKRDKITEILTGVVDSRGEASFQKARLTIDTLSETRLPDGSTFRFYDLMDKRVLDPYARYADNVSGRAALADAGLGTPTLWAKAVEEHVTGSPQLVGKPEARKRYYDLTQDIYNDLLGYPVGKQLHPILIALRAFTMSISLKNSGIWQPMELVPVLDRHAKANGLGRTLRIAATSLFKSSKSLDVDGSKSLLDVLYRASMDDLKISPNSSRMADNHQLNETTAAGKINHMSQWTHVVNGMRFAMGRQAVISANLIGDTIERAVKGDAKSIHLLKNYGFNDADISDLVKQVKENGLDYNKWNMDSKGDLLPKLINLMDTDVLRSRTGEIPAAMQYSNVGKVLGTYRNFVVTAQNKILASQLKDEGVTAVALLTAYQAPIAIMAVQAASIAKGDGLIEDPKELMTKAFTQLGGLGILPELVGILSGDTRGFGSPFLLGVDRVIGVGNDIGNIGINAFKGESSMEDFTGLGASLTNVIPIASVTLGWTAGWSAVFEAMEEFEED